MYAALSQVEPQVTEDHPEITYNLVFYPEKSHYPNYIYWKHLATFRQLNNKFQNLTTYLVSIFLSSFMEEINMFTGTQFLQDLTLLTSLI